MITLSISRLVAMVLTQAEERDVMAYETKRERKRYGERDIFSLFHTISLSISRLEAMGLTRSKERDVMPTKTERKKERKRERKRDRDKYI